MPTLIQLVLRNVPLRLPRLSDCEPQFPAFKRADFVRNEIAKFLAHVREQRCVESWIDQHLICSYHRSQAWCERMSMASNFKVKRYLSRAARVGCGLEGRLCSDGSAVAGTPAGLRRPTPRRSPPVLWLAESRSAAMVTYPIFVHEGGQRIAINPDHVVNLTEIEPQRVLIS